MSGDHGSERWWGRKEQGIALENKKKRRNIYKYSEKDVYYYGTLWNNKIYINDINLTAN